MTEKFTVTVPSTLNMGNTGSFSDFDTIINAEKTKTMLIAGGKHFKDSGRILCTEITVDGASELEECPWQPTFSNGGFGFSVKNVGVIDGLELTDKIVVGMPEYIHEF
jgi:hypothetical protein